MRYVVAICAVLAAASPAAAFEMVCNNGMHDYLAVFDAKAQTFILDPDSTAAAYKVEKADSSQVSGDVGYDSGLTFVAVMDAPMRIEFYSGDKLVQTDTCHTN